MQKDEDRRLHAVKENLLLHKNAKSDVKFMWNIYLSVAKKYTDNLREEAMKGWAEKLAQGWLPCVPPPGYKTVAQNGKRIHVPDPETKELIQRAFKKYVEPGESLASVAEEMESMGIRTRNGKPYYKSKVQDMPLNPFFIGINHFNGKDYPGAQEPIISKILFNKVQQKMHKGRARAYFKHNPSLKGLIRCADCGTVVTWQLHKGYFYGACRRDSEACKRSKLLREDRVEALILDILKPLVCPSQEIIDWVAESMKEKYSKQTTDHERLVTSINTQISRINRMLDSLYDDKLAGEITKERYGEKYEQFMKEKTELSERINNLNKPLGLQLEQRLVLLELSQKAAQIYIKKSPDQKRLILSNLFCNFTLKDGSLSVEYTKFASAIAGNVQKTIKLMEEAK